MNTYSITYNSYNWQNYDTFTKGKVVARSESAKRGYWFGHDEIRETPKYFYLLVAGEQHYQSASHFAHHIYRVDKSELQSVDLQDLVSNLRGLEHPHYGKLETYNEEQYY